MKQSTVAMVTWSLYLSLYWTWWFNVDWNYVWGVLLKETTQRHDSRAHLSLAFIYLPWSLFNKTSTTHWKAFQWDEQDEDKDKTQTRITGTTFTHTDVTSGDKDKQLQSNGWKPSDITARQKHLSLYGFKHSKTEDREQEHWNAVRHEHNFLNQCLWEREKATETILSSISDLCSSLHLHYSDGK